MRTINLYKWLFLAVLLSCNFTVDCHAAERIVEAKITLADVFALGTDMGNGIIGTVDNGGEISVRIYDKVLNTLVYHAYINSTTDTFTGNAINYAKESLGSGAAYYPNTWSSRDFKTALLSSFRKKYDSMAVTAPYPLFSEEEVALSIHIDEKNAQLHSFKIPAIGIIDSLGGNSLFHPNHFCHDLSNNTHPVTRAWLRMKKPDMNKGCDVIIAAHRGIWGDKLGDGNPENSTAAIRDTKKFTDVLESDIMITKDKELIVSHDYNLKRLSDYSGADTDYLFRMDASQLDGVKLRKRNMTVSEYSYLTFGDIVDELISCELVLTIDIKDIIARYKDGVCIDNCDYDPKTHGEEANKRRLESWMDIFKGCIRVAASKNALQYIAFKVPHTYSLLEQYVPDDTLSMVQFMPVIQPGRKDYLDFTDAWIKEGGNRVIAYETNFKKKDDDYLKPIDRDGKHYENFLHYVYAKTGLRPGCYPEEPMGPKGIVNRWAEWMIKDLRKDIRGDYYFLMSVPYGKIMVLTTDRPDMWLIIDDIYNKHL